MTRHTPRRTAAPTVVGAVLAANLRRLARDRIGLAFIIAVPFLLILLIGLANPGGDGSVARPVGLVAPADASGPTARLVAALEADPTLRLTRFGDVDAMTAAVRRRVQAAGIEIPSDLASTLASGGRADVRFYVDPSGVPPLAIRTAVAQAVDEVGAGLRGARVVAERTGISVAAALDALDAVPTFGAPEVERETLGAAGRTLPGGFAYAAPAYLVLFMFINTLVAAWGLPADRASGLTRRTLAAPTTAAAVLVGEWLYRLVVALVQAALIVVVGAMAFGVAWGDPLAVAAIVLAFALASTGASILLGSLARTPEQVTAIAPPLGIALGMLGGCMWPLEIVGPTLRAIGHATPHAWAVGAFTDVVGAGAGLADIAPDLAAIMAFAVVLLGVALAVFARSVKSATG